jgi:glutathione S-transferase
MTLVLYGHPFSSYTQKALIALYENATLFEFRVVDPATPENFESLKKLWPIAKFPVLEDEGLSRSSKRPPSLSTFKSIVPGQCG